MFVLNQIFLFQENLQNIVPSLHRTKQNEKTTYTMDMVFIVGNIGIAVKLLSFFIYPKKLLEIIVTLIIILITTILSLQYLIEAVKLVWLVG